MLVHIHDMLIIFKLFLKYDVLVEITNTTCVIKHNSKLAKFFFDEGFAHLPRGSPVMYRLLLC
jgi:hypothetical protein